MRAGRKTRSDSNNSALNFSLEKNPRTVKLLVALALAGAYIFVDGFMVTESYTSIPLGYEVIWSTICLLIIAFTMKWLRSGMVPWGVCLGLGFIVFLALYPALYIGTLRINMATDTGGLMRYRYYVEPGIRLVPARAHLPVITYYTDEPYWQQYSPNKPVEIELRHGGLGIWQFNLEKIREDMREYYRSQQPAGTKNIP